MTLLIFPSGTVDFVERMSQEYIIEQSEGDPAIESHKHNFKFYKGLICYVFKNWYIYKYRFIGTNQDTHYSRFVFVDSKTCNSENICNHLLSTLSTLIYIALKGLESPYYSCNSCDCPVFHYYCTKNFLLKLFYNVWNKNKTSVIALRKLSGTFQYFWDTFSSFCPTIKSPLG